MRPLIILLVIGMVMMGFAGCGEMVNRAEKEDLVISADEISFVFAEGLVDAMEEKGYDSLTVYSHKVKT